MNEIPKYYKTSLDDIENSVKSAKKAHVSQLCLSAGKRPVFMLRYGKNVFNRTANLSSALVGR